MVTKKQILADWGSEDRYKLARARGALSQVEIYLKELCDQRFYELQNGADDLLTDVRKVLKETADKPVRPRKSKR